MKHGADLISYKAEDAVDFSSNINPLSYPKGLKEYMNENFDTVLTYPDIKYRKLKENISKYLGLASENILVGNGSMEIIDLLISLRPRVFIPKPSFSEYEERATIRNIEVIKISANDDLDLDYEKIKEAIQKNQGPACLVLANPNNPTGYSLEYEKFKDLYFFCKEKDVNIIVDEAFYEFTDAKSTLDLAKENNFDHIQVIRAATKVFALPGIRLGYAGAGEDIVKALEALQNPWSVNSFAVLASDIIFNDPSYIESSKNYIKNQREYMLGELEKIPSLKVYHGNANFILFELIDQKSKALFDFLLENKILVRTFYKDFHENSSAIRICVGKEENNRKIINLIKEFYNAK